MNKELFSSEYIGLGLLGLLIFQQVYYTIVINKLVNKLMSRNYHEYQEAQKVLKSEPEKPKLFDDRIYEDLTDLPM